MKRNSISLLILLTLSLLLSCARTPQQLISEKPAAPVVDLTSEKIRDSIVLIEGENISGTGFFVAPDKIATSTHVVAHAGPVFVKSPDTKKDWTIEGVIGFDAKNGLVILKLTDEGTPLPLGDTVQIGESVSILSYPDGAFKVSESSIQSLRKSNRWLRLNTTTAKKTNGSPVFNDNGQVIGVIVPYGRYAIPSSALKTLLDASMPTEPLMEWQQRKQVRAAAYYGLGKEKLDAKDYTGAIVDFDKVIEIDTEYADAYNNRGLAKLRFGESETASGNAKKSQRLYKAAIEDITRSIQMDPEDADSYNNRGLAKFNLGEAKSARGKVKKVKVKKVKKTQRFYEAAIADYTQAIKMHPKYADAYENRATVNCKLGDIESARGDAEKAQRLYHEGITDYDKYTQLNNPEGVNALAADLTSEKVKNSTVRVMSWAGNFYYGSGFFVKEDKVATNVHVVAQPGPVFVKLRDKAEICAVEAVTAFDAENDLVILKIGGEGIPLSLGDSGTIQRGEPVVVVGYPNEKYRVIKGTIRSASNGDEWLRMTPNIGSGGSGSPVLSSGGQVVGISTAGNEDYEYAIPSSILKALLAQSEATEPLAKWQKRELIRAYALSVQGQMNDNANRYHEAIADYDKAVKINSQFFYAYYKRGNAQSALGNHEAAIADYNKAVKINDGIFNIYFDLGLAKSKLGDNEAAIVDYDKAIKIDPESTDAYNNRGVLYDDLGDLESARGNTEKAETFYKAAIADYDKVIQLAPESTGVYNSRGVLYDDLGDLESARGNMEKAEAFYKAAIADYDKVIQIDPEYTGVYNNRGVSHYHLGGLESARGNTEKAEAFYEAAIADYDKVIQIDPEHANAYNNRGVLYDDLGGLESARGNIEKAEAFYEAAIADYDKAIQIDPEYTDAYSNRGVSHYHFGDLESARGNMEKAEAFYKAAKADFEKAKELDPDVGQ